MRYKHKKIFSDLWLDEYIGKDGMCLLCFQNSGVIVTRDGTRWCICPNGRVKKELFFKPITK